MMIAALSAVAFGLLMGSVQGDKDDSYYIAGTGNPNKDEKMYWKDAENIFQDLSEFQTLYVEFHNCAWTWMMMADEDNDIDENDYWYMGKIPPMGANVAYSLYGSLYGESFSGCSEDTFINSFYTNSGFTNFARAMNYAGLSGFSSYSYDDDYSSSYTASCGGGYGVGCDYSNGFAMHTYSGDTCDPANFTGVSDTLSSLNSAMNAAQCIQIYDASNYGGSPYGTPLEVLAYSHSCFYQDFFSPDGICPDPYGKLAYYQQQFYNGIQESKKQDPYQVSQRKEQYQKEIRNGKIFTVAGMALAGLAFIIFFYECAVACFGQNKEVKMLEYVPRKEDFIISKRSEDESSPTEGDKSETSSRAEMYVTMSLPTDDAYSPPVDVPPQPSAVPPTPQGAASPPVAVTPTTLPSLAVPPAQVPASEASPPSAPGEPVTVTLYAPPCMAAANRSLPTSEPAKSPALEGKVEDEDSIAGTTVTSASVEALEKQLAELAMKLQEAKGLSLQAPSNSTKPAEAPKPVEAPKQAETLADLAAKLQEAKDSSLQAPSSSVKAAEPPKGVEPPKVEEAPEADEAPTPSTGSEPATSPATPVSAEAKATDSVPAIDKIVASREEFSSEEEGDNPKSQSDAVKSEEQQQQNISSVQEDGGQAPAETSQTDAKEYASQDTPSIPSTEEEPPQTEERSKSWFGF